MGADVHATRRIMADLDTARTADIACAEPLRRAAARLIETGAVSAVRVHQDGAVITGIVASAAPAAPHRVYIRRRTGQPAHAECNCGERDICVHVVAVSMLAQEPGRARRALAAAHVESDSGTGIPASLADPTTQQICYLFGSPGDSTPAHPETATYISVWVCQRFGRELSAATAVAYAPGAAQARGQYPRYVDPQDQEILTTLSHDGHDAPWQLRGLVGANVFAQAVRSGRAFWGTLESRPLRPGPPRRATLAWHADAAGNQRLGCHAGEHVLTLLSLDPAHYVDVLEREAGTVELPCARALIARYGQRQVAPEDAAAVNLELARDRDATGLARLAEPRLRRLPRARLGARVILGAGASAQLLFLYNGLPVASEPLAECSDGWIRRSSGNAVYEMQRDRDGERAFAAQFRRMVPRPEAGEEAWLRFMLEHVPSLTAAGWDIVIEPQFPYRIVRPEGWVGAFDDGAADNWFHVRLGVLVNGATVNLLPHLAAYLHHALGDAKTADAHIPVPAGPPLAVAGHWLVDLQDGRYLAIALERFRRIGSMLIELIERDALAGERLRLPRSRRFSLGALQGEPDIAWRWQDPTLAATLADCTRIEALAAPAGFAAVLRPYQREGLGWLQFLRRHRLGGVLADDMGLGKTVQALAHLALEKLSGRLQQPALIVAPVSALAHWQQEIRRLAPGLSTLTLHGPRRHALFSALGGVDVLITGYPQLQLDAQRLRAQDFSVVILDEAQMIKNPRAKVAQAARALRAEQRLCLSGTPLENHLGELWSLFAFAQPDLLGGEREFQRHFRVPIEKYGNQIRADALAARLKPFLLRRTKDAVAPELPPKTEMLEYIALDEKQRDFYDAIRLAAHRQIHALLAEVGLARGQISILETLLKLRQACCDPRLVESGAAIPSAKIEWLCTALPALIEQGRRILLFSQFTSMLRLIEIKLRELGLPYCLLTGSTANRPAQVERFQSRRAPLFLISLKAGGTALNLTAADTVIHYDPWWNPAAEAQATDRAHRIGQSKPVFVYKLIAQGTVEERMLELHARKQTLAAGLYAGATAGVGALTDADLERLLAP